MAETRYGHLVEPYAAREAEIGWKILHGDEVVEVRDAHPAPARLGREGEDPQFTIEIDQVPWILRGEENQTIYRVVDPS